MTPEEFQRIKEAEKEHLRSLKKLKQAVRNLERQKKVVSAVENMKKSEDLIHEHDRLVDELAIETAQSEARLEVALESAAEQESIRRAEEARAKLDEDLQKARAKDLINQLKQEIAPPEPDLDDVATSTSEDTVDEVTPDAPEALPEKTIGKMRRK